MTNSIPAVTLTIAHAPIAWHSAAILNRKISSVGATMQQSQQIQIAKGSEVTEPIRCASCNRVIHVPEIVTGYVDCIDCRIAPFLRGNHSEVERQHVPASRRDGENGQAATGEGGSRPRGIQPGCSIGENGSGEGNNVLEIGSRQKI